MPPFFNGFVYAQLAIYALVLLVWKRDFGSPETRGRLLQVVRRVGVIAATVPASTFLANLLPWWRFPMPMLAVVASVALFVAVISAIALLGPWGRSAAGPHGRGLGRHHGRPRRRRDDRARGCSCPR